MESKLKKELQSTGISLLLIWVMSFVSGGITTWFFRREMNIDSTSDLEGQGIMMWVSIFLMFWISVGLIVNGIIKSRKLNKILKEEKIDGGNFFLWSFAVLAIPTLFSIQSLEGCNFLFFGMLISGADLGGMAIVGWLNVIGMIVWWLFPIFQYLGISAIAAGKTNEYNAISGFRKLKKSATILMVASFVFSPLAMSYINAATKTFEHTLVFNIIAGLALVAAIVYFYMEWKNALQSEIIPSDQIAPIEIVPTPGATTNLLVGIGKSYLFTGITVVLSLYMLLMYASTDSLVYLCLLWILFILGWYGIITGVKSALILKKIAPSKINLGPIGILGSFLVVALTSFFSFSTIMGVNLYSHDVMFLHDFDHLLRPFDHLFRHFEFDALIGCMSVISMLIFVLYGVFALCGTVHLSRIFPKLKKSVVWAALCLAFSLIFSSVLLLVETRAYYRSELLCLFGFVIFLICSVFFGLSWRKCTQMVKLTDYEQPEFDETLIGTLKKEKLVSGVVALAAISVIVSSVSLVSHIIKMDNNNEPELGLVTEMPQAIDLEEFENETEDIPEVSANELSEADIEADKRILSQLYNNLVLNLSMADSSWGDNFIANHLSPELKKRLMDDYDFDDDGYAWWTLRSWEKKYTSNHSELLEIEVLSDNWYRVNYIDNGVNDYKDLRVVNGVVMEYKNSED